MAKDDPKEEEKGFVVRDRRFSSAEEKTAEASKAKKEEEKTPKAEKAEEAPQKEEEKSEDAFQGETLPIDFANFTHSLYVSALIQLGEIADPQTKQPLKNLTLAKQTIDLIAMLKEKTKGNLTPEEDKLVDHILYELRMRYVKAKP